MVFDVLYKQEVIVIFCRNCATKLEEDYICCPICSESTTVKQAIIKNNDYSGFFSGYVTVPIVVIAILILFSIVGSIFNDFTKYIHILIPIAIIAYGLFMAWTIEKKRPNVK